MRAMVLTGIRQMEMRDWPEPQLRQPDDVKLKLTAVGVCGSDVHYYTTGRIGSQVVQYPFPVGHEGAGEVVAVGPAVRSLRPGDPVAIEPAVTCGTCDQCRAGRANTCRKIVFLGCPGQTAGCLGEYLVMPERNCLKMPRGLDPGQATISEPLAIGVYAVKRSLPMSGARLGILGSGPIGLCVLLPALAQGAAAVYCTDKIDARLDLARRCGAAWTGNPARQDVVREILAREPLGLDAVFECCGQQEAADQAIELLRPGAKLMYVGIPEVDRISFSIDKMRRKELCVQNVRRQEGCAHEALHLIAAGRTHVAPLITHRFPFARTKEAFDLVAAYGDGVVKAIVDFP